MKHLLILLFALLWQSCNTEWNSGSESSELSLTDKVRLELSDSQKVELYRTPKEIRIIQCISAKPKLFKIINSIDLLEEVPVTKHPFPCHFLFKFSEEDVHVSFEFRDLRIDGKQYKLTEKSSLLLYTYFKSQLASK